jgi:hypothetical protein
MIGSAQAHHNQNGSSIDTRIDRQSNRIERGVDDGSLTRKEQRRLNKQHKHIVKLARKFNRDGYFSKRERHILSDKLDLASQKIYRLKHNSHVAYVEQHNDSHYDTVQYRAPKKQCKTKRYTTYSNSRSSYNNGSGITVTYRSRDNNRFNDYITW